MRMKLYQVYDLQSESVIGPIIQAKHDNAAARTFTDALNDQKTSLHQHPEDYELLAIGEQDEETGEIISTGMRRVILTGEQWKTMQEVSAS